MTSERILIVKPSAMGDVIHTLPLLTRLRQGYPEAYIAWVVNRSCAGVVEDHPHLDEVVVFERQDWSSAADLAGMLSASRGLLELVRRLRQRHFDLALDLQGLFRSGLLTLLSGAPKRVGFSGAREFAGLAYTQSVRVPTADMHAVDRYLLFAEALGLRGEGEVTFVLPTSEADETWAEGLASRLTTGSKPLVLVNPTARWASKCWPATHYAELADRLVREYGAAVVFTGTAGDRLLVDRVRKMTAEQSTDLCGKTTVKQLIALMRRADLAVCNDSGPMHLAAALKTPVLAFYGPTSPVRTGPYGDATRCVVLRKDVPCGPCYRRECQRLLCLEAITADEAFEAAVNLLELNQGTGRESRAST